MNWNEVIKKENKNAQIYDNFDINPHHCNAFLISVHNHRKTKQSQKGLQARGEGRGEQKEKRPKGGRGGGEVEGEDSRVQADAPNEVQAPNYSEPRNRLDEL